MTVEASALRELHRLHRQRSDLQGRLDRGPRQIKAAEANIQRLQTELDTAKETLQQSRMTLDGKNLSLKEREARILDVKARLNTASSNKEYQAFMEQIAADEQANSVLSDEIIELLDRVSGDEGQVQKAEAALAKGKQDLQTIHRARGCRRRRPAQRVEAGQRRADQGRTGVAVGRPRTIPPRFSLLRRRNAGRS